MGLQLRAVMVNSQDPGKLKEFYSKVFGDPAWDQGGFTGWDTGECYLMVGPHDQVKGKSQNPARIMINLETPDVEGGNYFQLASPMPEMPEK
jgi:hypothetical protein